MAALLVTGGAGFIGTNFLYYLCRPQGGLNLSITVLDALHYAGRKERLQPLIDAGRIKFIRGDICDQTLVASILQRERIDTVVNFAAHTHVDRSIADPAPFYRNNVEGVCTLLTACCQYFLDEGHGGRFHQISTDEVYGTLSPDAPAWTEESPLDPSSPYSASKASADHFVSAFARTYGLQASISRCSNNYGPYQFPEKLLPSALQRLLTGQPVPVYGDGLQVRDWLYVDDHCKAVALMLGLKPKSHQALVCNVGGGTELTNLAFLELLYQTLRGIFKARPELTARYPDCMALKDQPFERVITHVADRKGHDRRYALKDDKLSALSGYAPSVSAAQGMERAVLWYIEHGF